MATLEELQDENKRLRGMQSTLREAEKNNQDRMKLARENIMLARRIKFDKSLTAGRKVSKVASDVGRRTGKGLAIVGKGAFKGIKRYAQFLERQENKQRSVNRKLKSVKKSKRR